jgi:glycerol-3-phosphate dehydrogenase (NAD(P)+)
MYAIMLATLMKEKKILTGRLGIVGNGRIGGALGDVFAANGWAINYFDTRTEMSTVKSLAELGQKSDAVIIAAPSWTNRKIVEELKPHIKDKLVVTVAKGVEPGFVTMEEMFQEVAQGHFDHGVIHGPMLAGEIAQKKPAAVLLATTAHRWADRFSDTSQVRIVYSDDPYSIALCGVLKNIFAITLGVNDGLQLGDNSKGALAVSIINEFQRVLADLGGDPEQALSLAGLGDFLATGWSDLSFNHRMGKMLVIDPKSTEPKGEGVGALQEIKAKIDFDNYPILGVTYRIVFEAADPKLIIKNLL